MHDADARIEVRSFRSVFELERRIYRVDRLRLNPNGVPVRGVVYFLALLLASVLLARVPLFGWPLDLLPSYVRYLLAPAGLAAVMAMARIDGRACHTALLAFAGLLVGPRVLSGFEPSVPIGRRWTPGQVTFLPDGSEPALRNLRYTGPGAILVRSPGTARLRTPQRRRGLPGGADLALGQGDGAGPDGAGPALTGRVLKLRAGTRVRVQGERARR